MARSAAAGAPSRRAAAGSPAALAGLGVGRGDTVAVMAPNIPAMLEAHYGVPMAGRRAQRPQHPARRRLDRLHPAARRGQGAAHGPRIRAGDPGGAGASPGATSSSSTSSIRQRRASLSAKWTTRRCSRRAIRRSPGRRPADEWDAIALYYTSGTTGNPKGVVYHHRGAYLNAWAMPLPSACAALGLSLDAADVPLQRLDLHLGGDARSAAPMSACAGSSRRAIFAADRRAWRDAYVRRAGGADAC